MAVGEHFVCLQETRVSHKIDPALRKGDVNILYAVAGVIFTKINRVSGPINKIGSGSATMKFLPIADR